MRVSNFTKEALKIRPMKNTSQYLDPDRFKLEGFFKEYPELKYGLTPLTRPMTIDLYKDWINEGCHGSMDYLKQHTGKKEQPQQLLPNAHSAIVIIKPYLPHPYPVELPLSGAGLAYYAQGKDYHHGFQEELNEICVKLSHIFKDDVFESYVDSKPVLERDLAFKAGLGWVGKNSCLINREQGSLFFIGEIYTSLKVKNTPTAYLNFCGTCTKCIDACPTNAIVEEKKVDARKCISYLTIERNEKSVSEYNEQIGGWLFGCDICQTVCPWNNKIIETHDNKSFLSSSSMVTKNINQNENEMESSRAQRNLLIKDLKWILESSNKHLQKKLKGTALARGAGNKLKRNALVVIANKNIIELKDLVSQFKDHHYLSDLSDWCMQKLSTKI